MICDVKRSLILWTWEICLFWICAAVASLLQVAGYRLIRCLYGVSDGFSQSRWFPYICFPPPKLQAKPQCFRNIRTYQPGGTQLACPWLIFSLGSCVLYPKLSRKRLEVRQLVLLPGWVWCLECWPCFIQFNHIRLIRAGVTGGYWCRINHICCNARQCGKSRVVFNL